MKKIFFLFLLLCGTFTLQAATITVTSGADAGAGTLRAAITSAVAGDDIVFSGITTVTLTSAELLINKNLTINGGTGITITRSGATEFRLFTIATATTVVFNKLSITNGKAAAQAGGVQNRGTLTLNDCIIANNESGQGGGLQNDGTMTMNRCVVHSNKATVEGSGLIIYGITTTLNNCVFSNNQGSTAIMQGGNAVLTITNCTIAKNGTGINILVGTVTLKNTIVAENTAAVSSPNIRGNNLSASSAYNLIGTEGGNGGLTNGTNNNKVGVSPLFANSNDPDGADNILGTADDGFSLTACNFATNAGNNADAPAGTDIVGNPRVFATTVDIGAYEFQANSMVPATITLGTIPAILAGATTFTIPYTATTGSPTTYSISGTGITAVTDAALPNSPIIVNLTAAASTNLSFTLTVKNAGGCTYSITGSVYVIQSITWTGAVSTDWNTANNWSPNVVPTATYTALINDVTNDPIILSGTTAVAKEIYLYKDAALKVNSGGILNVNVTTVPVNIYFQGGNNSLTNDGTINVGTGSGFGFFSDVVASITNRGTINTNNENGIVTGRSGILTFTNESMGLVNSDFRASVTSSISLINRGTINYSRSTFAFNFYDMSSLVNEGTIKITGGFGISNLTGSTITNRACGQILMSAGVYTNSGTTTNAGLISITNNLNNTGGTFTNTGVLKYGSLTGTVTSNQNSSIIVNNTQSVFTYGGTFNGTINGIFRDSLATVSAGTFTAPNDFRPLQALPTGAQTLYIKITPSGGACSYTVPFTYTYTPRTSTKEVSNGTELHQNRPNPFSQQTIISFVLPETTKAVLTVYDITGREVFTSNKGFNSGLNEVILQKSIFQHTGTYFYRLTSDNYSVVKRLQFVAE
jgi:drug/metabolite transporter superfamily protein YnfA